MRVIYIYPFCSLGGVETSVINKMELLKRIDIYTEAIFQNVWGEGAKYIFNYPNVRYGMNVEELIKHLRDNFFDIITLIDSPIILNLVNKYKIKSKIIYETHNSIYHKVKSSYRGINNESVSAIIVPSEYNIKLIRKVTEINKNVFVLPNPIEMDIFSNIPISRIDSYYQSFYNKKNIIWIGRLESYKNPIEFIKIANMLLENDKNLNFIMVGDICGDVDYFKFVKSNIQQEYIGCFNFIQSIPNEKMPEIYSLAANTGGCLVSTSKYESLPMIFLEAMSCRCPVVSTDIGGIRELVEDNVTGKLYKLNNLEYGYWSVRELINEKSIAHRNRIIENAYSLVKERHSVEQVASIYKSIFNCVINA